MSCKKQTKRNTDHAAAKSSGYCRHTGWHWPKSWRARRFSGQRPAITHTGEVENGQTAGVDVAWQEKQD